MLVRLLFCSVCFVWLGKRPPLTFDEADDLVGAVAPGGGRDAATAAEDCNSLGGSFHTQVSVSCSLQHVLGVGGDGGDVLVEACS